MSDDQCYYFDLKQIVEDAVCACASISLSENREDIV